MKSIVYASNHGRDGGIFYFASIKKNVGIMIQYLVLRLEPPLESLTVTATTWFTVAVFVDGPKMITNTFR